MTPDEARRRDLETLSDERFDVVIVGGGIVGVGALLDAASRGLSAALVEQGDIASGTSSRSSRLIHGGLRYLQQFRFGLVFEALAERARLLRLAPHLVRLEPVLFPIYGRPLVHRTFYGSGMMLYDLLGARRDGGFARHLGREAALAWTPALRRDGLRGGIVYHDGVEDDARFAIAVARTALHQGATAVTRVRAIGLLESGGRVTGIRAHDVVGGADIEIRAAAVLDATGVWMSQPDAPLGGRANVVPSKGSHIVVRRDRIPSRSGLTIRIPGRIVFLVPWPGHWIIGTTDDPWPGRPDHPVASATDVERILSTVNRTLDVELSTRDVVGTYAGLRPLAASAAGGSTVKASREHRVTTDRPGLVRVVGGKYTTYRLMAEDAIDAVLAPVARDRPSMTREIPLVGALDRPALAGLVRTLVGDGLDRALAERLVDRHGSETPAVLSLGRDLGLLDRLGPEVDHLAAEVAWAVRHELAMTLEDVLGRRMRLAQERPDRGASLVTRAARVMGVELDWSNERREVEIARYLAAAERDYGVPAMSGS